MDCGPDHSQILGGSQLDQVPSSDFYELPISSIYILLLILLENKHTNKSSDNNISLTGVIIKNWRSSHTFSHFNVLVTDGIFYLL